ncbi:flagellar biosynthesis protein FlaG [Colwellia sp. MT41]|uniref:Protein FlaG n=1 Tax=Colwellia marinimaniae TaxID=1513592 RepID=A0ABQ0MV86_9GAMM|nr:MULTISPECIES: flagellar protein FlaG [Colwellia]ALO34271.1 flagellar biosynthesis protein FlaG [Colwellia sp. MT41]GAW96284.1 protein FlaG [Colwellia marinimaniae]
MSTIASTTDIALPNLTAELNKSVDSAVKAVEATVKTSDLTVNELASDEQSSAVSLSEQAKELKQAPLTTEQLEKVAQQLQEFVGNMNRGLEFSVDKDSGRDVIKVIDKNSGELVKQFPSEEVLTLVAKLSEMVGAFIDAKV